MPFIVDRQMRRSCIEKLKTFDNDIYFSANCDWIYKPVNTHPDLQIHFVDNKTAFVPPELFEYYKSILPGYIEINRGNKRLGGSYPYNVAYNITRIGNKVILNEKYADDKIIEYYKGNNFQIINVRQGYTKCNICTDGKLAVTEDDGIYKALSECGIKTLKIAEGEVSLENFPYGFIGGASGFINNSILLCGKMKNELAFNEICEFFAENNTQVELLDEKELKDYGSVLYFE